MKVKSTTKTKMIYLLKSGFRVWVLKEEERVGVLLCVCTNPSPQTITFTAEDIDHTGCSCSVCKAEG